MLKSVFHKLDSKQFSLVGRSTTKALTFFPHVLLETLDRCYVKFLFFDFTKGFDLADHSILFRELDKFNINPFLISWVASFLYNRSQMVKIENILSPPLSSNATGY